MKIRKRKRPSDFWFSQRKKAATFWKHGCMRSSPSAQWFRFGNLRSKQARCRCIEVELQSSNGPTSELPRKNKGHLTMNERSFIVLAQCLYPNPIAVSIEELRSLMRP